MTITRTMQRVGCTTALLCLLAPLASATPESPDGNAGREIRKVHVELTSFGLGGSVTESIDLVAEGQDFARSGFTSEDARMSHTPTRSAIVPARVQGDRVRALGVAIAAPPLARGEGIARLTSPQWLDAHAEATYDAVTSGEPACSPQARDLFLDRYRSGSAVVSATNAYYDTRWTDDYASAEVQVTYVDGSTTTLQSRSQHALMLPWNVGNVSTWNPAIARAMAGILPKSTILGAGFSSADLVASVARDVRGSIEAQWEDLEGRCVYKALIARLGTRYEVRDVSRGSGGFNGTLRSSDMPGNLMIDLHLPPGVSREASAAFDRFMALAPAYVAVARPFVMAHPATNFELWYAKGHSFDFDDDEVYGDEDAVEFLRKQPRRNEGVLLRASGNENDHREWIVLPGGESVVWKGAN